MANTKSAAKRARQTITRTTTNRRSTSTVKSNLKKVRSSIEGGKKAEATEAAKQFLSSMDKAVKAGRVHRNSANRHKSVIQKALAKLA